MFGLDDEMLEMVPKPVASLLLLFPITDQIGAFYKEQQNKIDEPDHEVNAFLMTMAGVQQISANRGPDLRFIFEVNIKTLIS